MAKTTIVDARLLEKAASAMAAITEKDMKIMITSSHGEWGEEPGETEAITMIAQGASIVGAVRIPVDGLPLDESFLITQSSAKLISSICASAIKIFNDAEGELGDENNSHPISLSLRKDDKTLSIVPGVPEAAGVIVSADFDPMYAPPFEGIKKLLEEGGNDSYSDEGSEVEDGSLVVFDKKALATLSRVSGSVGNFPLKIYAKSHMATSHQVMCGLDDKEAGTVLVSMAVSPEMWEDWDDVTEPSDVVYIPEDIEFEIEEE